MKVSIVILLELRSSSSVYAAILLIACQSFSFDNCLFERLLCSIIVSNKSV